MNEIIRKFDKVMERILDYSEVAVPEPTYKKFRSKVLRVCNDYRRFLLAQMEEKDNGKETLL